MESKQTVRFVIQGRVQGVGFRQFTRQEARSLDIEGFVTNRPDGSVECLARGSLESMDQFQARLKKGPPLSRVESVVATPETTFPAGIKAGFQIL